MRTPPFQYPLLISRGHGDTLSIGGDGDQLKGRIDCAQSDVRVFGIAGG